MAANISPAVAEGQQPGCLPVFAAIFTVPPVEKSKHNRSITEADRAAAARLRDLWEAERPRRTQADLAEEYGESANQSLISQYLGGTLAIGVAATLKFARIFNVPPSAIRPDIEDLQAAELSIAYAQLPPRHMHVLETFDRLPEHHKRAWQAVGDALAQSQQEAELKGETNK